MPRMKKALVTGAAGFIGSHLCERLVADGYEVRGVDSFTPHYSRQLKELNLAELRDASGFAFEERDLAVAEIEDLVSGVDEVFHLAARPGVRDSWADFDDYVRSNVLATKRLLDACVGEDLRLVVASSSSVYGDAADLPASEAAPLQPISPYGATKVTTEAMANAYARSRGLHLVSLRYFTVYGPRQRPDMGISRFIEAAVAGREIMVFGDGLQRRDMTYVADAVSATVAAVSGGEPGRAYNVASGTPRPLLEVLDALARTLEEELSLRHIEPQLGDVRDTWGDISRARRDLGYSPATSLEDGLARQVAEAARRRSVVEPASQLA